MNGVALDKVARRGIEEEKEIPEELGKKADRDSGSGRIHAERVRQSQKDREREGTG